MNNMVKRKIEREMDEKYMKIMFEEMNLKRERKSKFKFVIYVLLGLWIASSLIGGLFEDRVGDKLAVITIEGPIMGSSQGSSIFGEVVNSQDIVNFIEDASERESVKAILLEINSPGGTVVASKEIVVAVGKVDKPVVALIREIGTSGAYWVASAADYIVADELSLAGSIGVRGGYLEFSGLMEEYGVGYEALKAGKYKDVGNPYEELGNEERKILEGKLELIHESFILSVAENRNLSVESVRGVAEGLYYLGVEAKEFGLIDGFGGMDEAKKKAEELSGVEELKEIKYEKKKGLMDYFGGAGLKGFYGMGRGIGDSFNAVGVDGKDLIPRV